MAPTPADRSATAGRDLSQDANQDPSQEELVADIEQTRAQLGETVDALAHKLDVKAQARAHADATKQRLQQQVTSLQSMGRRAGGKAKDAATDDNGHVAPRFPLAAASAIVLLLAVVLIRRRQR